MLDATPLARLYAKRRLARLNALDPVAAQERQLLRLVRKARETRFGRDHHFSRIDSVRAFQERVPLRRYEAFWDSYWKDTFPALRDVTWPGVVSFLAESSGTSSGKTKYLPITREMIDANQRAALTLIAFHLANKPDSHVLGGKNFMLGGSVAMRDVGGVRAGDLSGIAAATVPFWAKPFYYPPRSLASIEDWEDKTRILAEDSVTQDIRAIGGTASWLLLYFDRLREFTGNADGTLRDFYPHLELVVYGGVAFEPYRDRFEAYRGETDIDLREVYPASEGFIAIADRGVGEGLRLLLDNGLFYEFVPLDQLESERPTRHWIADAEPGVNYALVLSSCAGAWAYVLGDTVRLDQGHPPRLRVTGRTSYFLSAFGEHVIDEELEKAAAAAARAVGRAVTDFSVAPLYPDAQAPRGRHLWLIEFEHLLDAAGLARAAAAIDATLSELNADYLAHRSGGFGMDPPLLEQIPPGDFARWMKSRGKLGGQNKTPRVILDPSLLDSLRQFAAAD
jgi:hypothetical protein